MANVKPVVSKNAGSLAKALGLPAATGHAWEVQAALLQHLRQIVLKRKVIHADLGKLAGTSRTRVTSILNGNLAHVSTDLLIRLLGALGNGVTVSARKLGRF